MDQLGLARSYLAMQGAAGAAWWISVALSSHIREWTLGGWNAAWLALPDLVLFAGASGALAWRFVRPVAIMLAGWTAAITVGLGIYALVEQRAGWGALLMLLALVGTVASTLTLWHGYLPVSWFFIGPFKFREAKDTTSANHLRNSLAQLILFWSFFLIFVPLVLHWLEHRIRIDFDALDRVPWTVGAAVFATGSTLGLSSCISMAVRGDGTPLPAATASKLVIAGPYRYVRNPMAVAGAIQTIGVGLWIGSWTALFSALVGAVLWNAIIRPSEEADLAARFGESYDGYCANVRCWWPRLPSVSAER